MSNNPFQTQFLDSADHYSDAQILRKWDSIHFGHVIPGGRFGNCLFAQQGLLPGSVSKILFVTGQAWQVGFAFQLTTGAFGLPGGILYQNPATTGGNSVATLHIANDGTVWADTTVGFIGFGNRTINVGQWYYVEFQFASSLVLDSTTGHYFMQINCALLSIDGQIQFTKGSFLTIDFGVNIVTPDHYTGGEHDFSSPGTDILFDDVYIFQYSNLNTADPTLLLGDARVDCKFPISDYGINMWSPVGSPHWSLLNDNPPDDNTSFIDTINVNDVDEWNFDTTTTAYHIAVLQHSVCTFGNNERIDFICGNYAGSHTQGDRANSIAFWEFNSSFLSINPVAGLPWTVADYNVMPFGVIYIGP